MIKSVTAGKRCHTLHDWKRPFYSFMSSQKIKTRTAAIQMTAHLSGNDPVDDRN